MEKILLVSVFAFSLFLKVAIAAGAESEISGSGEEEAASVSEKSTTIQNTINVAPSQMATPATSTAIAPSPMYAQTNPNTDAASVLGTAQRDSEVQPISITPLIGGTAYSGNWYEHVRNSYTLGLMLEVPASERFSIELEGTYARSNVSYSSYGHDFNQYSIGANGKFYLSRSVIQPYLGAGMSALRYENMSYGPYLPYSRYSQWMGAPQAIAGMDVQVAKYTAVGIRGEWVLPLINRPSVRDNGRFAYPYFEEASLMNTTFFRVMGSVRLSF